MSEGAFAMIDALGYREAVRGQGAEQTIRKMVALVKAVKRESAVHAFFHSQSPSFSAVPEVMFVSDAVFVGVRFPAAHREREAVEGLSLFLSVLMGHAAKTEPRLLYRGCITVGDYLMRDGFVGGPAVVSAADVAEKAEGAFVWLDARAAKVLEVDEERPDGPIAGCLVKWAVPLKALGSYRTWVVVPDGVIDPRDRGWIDRTCSRFDEGDRVDVQIKGQNTRAFFEAAAKILEAALHPTVKKEWAETEAEIAAGRTGQSRKRKTL